jgi:formate/nitrite transporter FocA (FNT family)
VPAPNPGRIFERAADEGQRRLDQSMLELVATSFIAGFAIMFGIAALGIAHSTVDDSFTEVARLAGALAFAVGFIVPVIGRVELFNENFFDPGAAAARSDEGWLVGPQLRLWSVTLVVNLVGGALFVGLFSVEGVLPTGAGESLVQTSLEIAHLDVGARLASAVAGGALVALLSHLLVTVETSGSRIAVTYLVGFLLALGPFDHVVVTGLHLLSGIGHGAPIGLGRWLAIVAIATVGNLVGGLGLVTVSHVAQAKGAEG